MIESGGPSYCGLPVPEEDELLYLQLVDFAGCVATSPDILANKIIERNNFFSLVIARDIDFWLNQEKPPGINKTEIAEFTAGIEDGYRFFIGVNSMIRYLRSGKGNHEEFLAAAIDNGDIPSIGRREVERIALVRSGQAPVDTPAHGGCIENSTDLAFIDASTYLFTAVRLETLMHEKEECIGEMQVEQHGSIDHIRVASRKSGFEHGVANAVEMYLQVAEERLLARAEDHTA